MKKLVTAFALCASFSAFAQVESSNIVGYNSGLSLVAGNYNMLSAPFTSVGSTTGVKIKNMFSDNSVFVAGGSSVDADTISIWENGAYSRDYIYSADAGNVWASVADTFTETEDTIPVGTGFWLYRQGNAVASLTIAGQVVTTNVNVDIVAANFNFLSNPFAAPLKIKNMFVNNALFVAGGSSVDADTISLWENGAYSRDYIYSADAGNVWASVADTFTETEDEVPAGQGFWVFRQGSAVTVTLDCPY